MTGRASGGGDLGFRVAEGGREVVWMLANGVLFDWCGRNAITANPFFSPFHRTKCMPALLNTWQDYVLIEEGSGEPSRVQCMFERAIASLQVDHAMWSRYLSFLDDKLKVM